MNDVFTILALFLTATCSARDWPIRPAFSLIGEWEFTDVPDAKRQATDFLTQDVVTHDMAGEFGRVMLNYHGQITEKGYTVVEVYSSHAAWQEHVKNVNTTQLAGLGKLIKMIKMTVQGPRDSIEPIKQQIEAHGGTVIYAPINETAVGPIRFGIYDEHSPFPFNAMTLVSTSIYNNESCKATVAQVVYDSIGHHGTMYEEFGAALLDYNMTLTDTEYHATEMYSSLGGFLVHQRHTPASVLPAINACATFKSVAMFGPKASLEGDIERLIKQYGGKTFYGRAPESIVGDIIFGVVDKRHKLVHTI